MDISSESWAKALKSLCKGFEMEDGYAEIKYLEDYAGRLKNAKNLSTCFYEFIKACCSENGPKNTREKEINKDDWNVIGSDNIIDFFKTLDDVLQKGGNISGQKGNVFKKLQRDYVAPISKIYEKDRKQNAKLIAAIQIDEILYKKKELSIEGAINEIENDKLAWPDKDILDDEKKEIVDWYLNTLRNEIRKDITLVKSQKTCDKCGNSYEEGSKCGNCEEAQKYLKEAKNYQKNEQWIEARNAANEVLEIWENNEEADNIVKKAQEQLDREISNITNNINQLIKENKFIDAEKKAKEKKELFGGEKYQEIIKKIEEAKQDYEEKIKKAKENFKEYLKKEYVEELQKFNIAISTEKYEDAKNALEQVKQIANTLKNYNEKIHSLEKEEKQLKELQEKLIVNNLPKVQKLNVITSKEKFELKWINPTEYNYGWRINRKEGNGLYKTVVNYTTTNTFEDKKIQQGTTYTYKIIPVYQKSEKDFLTNDNNAVESDAVSFVENIKNVVGSGEGIDDCASVELQWDMPKILNAEIEITREPKFPSPVVLKGCKSKYSDLEVKVGEKYIYTLTLIYSNNKCAQVKSPSISVQKAKPLGEFSNLDTQQVGDGEFIIKWDWIGNESGAKIIKSNQSFYVEKKINDSNGEYNLILQRGEIADIELIPYRKIGEKEFLGKGIMLNFGSISKIVCTLIKPPFLNLKREPYILELITDKTKFPELEKIKVCIGKSEPMSVHDGVCLGSPKQYFDDVNKAILEIPTRNKGFITVFLDSTISKEWKLVQPERNYIG